ncbi:hypothetical protein ABFS82_01G018700 [Erythranthe guttata]|uniref:Bet v I/Major latex protein domain-containing protein n=1 Tax=Erythranthe guttata TaxID=4155 RepID=A0A022PX84_ERYGU|nr:PREDICTED: lachrymatory-factor synthase [Erythranthe guttata]EYU20416.1 hypothetical protein MIMGU_mgv1a022381mg [Erythranthe guttata]|eukprot:XP_012857772.1 PREDICTED: lachrymatory-factor synthase [Erythranthe guttata]
MAKNLKWEAEVSTTLQKATADQIWPLFQDFFGLHKWFPGLATCYGIHGSNGEPGCMRYCSGSGGLKREGNINTNTNNNDDGDSNLSWSKERLVAISGAKMTFTYEIVDCNIGFESYVSTVTVVPGGGGGGGCTVRWRISLDPVVGWNLEDLVGRYELGLQRMLKKMEASIFGF